MNRAELILKLEELLGKRVFAMVYNPADEEGIKEGDEEYIEHFMEEILKKEGIRECILILSGFGGNLKTAILCSGLLRKNLERYSCFVPTVASSSLCYFVLQSDKLLITEKSVLTQIDPMFNYDGEDLRAIRHLNDSDPRVKALAHSMYNPVFENLRRILQNRPHVFEKEVSRVSKSKVDYLIKLVDIWMGKELHESGLGIRDLKELKVVFKVVRPEISEIAKILIKKCLEELMDEGKRFVIQTNRIEEGKYGGYFHP